jgi:hypothetical protein
MRRLLAFSLFLLLVSGAFAQTSAAGADASSQQGKAKVVFYYSRPVPIKNCLEQVGIQIDGVTAHQIFQWHVWQTEVAAGIHSFSDDSRKDKGVTGSLTPGQTYFYQLVWRKGFGFPKCDNFFARMEEMKPKEIQKATALLGKPGMDETAASHPRWKLRKPRARNCWWNRSRRERTSKWMATSGETRRPPLNSQPGTIPWS